MANPLLQGMGVFLNEAFLGPEGRGKGAPCIAFQQPPAFPGPSERALLTGFEGNVSNSPLTC